MRAGNSPVQGPVCPLDLVGLECRGMGRIRPVPVDAELTLRARPDRRTEVSGADVAHLDSPAVGSCLLACGRLRLRVCRHASRSAPRRAPGPHSGRCGLTTAEFAPVNGQGVDDEHVDGDRQTTPDGVSRRWTRFMSALRTARTTPTARAATLPE